MGATNLAAIVVVAAGYAGSILATWLYLGARIDGLEKALGDHLDAVEDLERLVR